MLKYGIIRVMAWIIPLLTNKVQIAIIRIFKIRGLYVGVKIRWDFIHYPNNAINFSIVNSHI